MNVSSQSQFAIALPQVYVEEPVDPVAISDYAARAEALGYAGLWTQDQIVGAATTLEAVGLLCYVAARTQSIRLGVSVIVLPHREPVPLAKSLATLDQLSQGRLDVGLGLGNPHSHEAAFAMDAAGRGERLRRFRDGLAVMKALWRDGLATVDKGSWRLDRVPMEPKPVQRPHPQLWFGGRHPNAIARAVREADGWMGAGSSTPQDFVTQRALVAEQLDAAGRDPATFKIAKRMYVAVDDDEARAERRLRTWFDSYYGNPDLANQVCLWGSKDKVLSGIAAVTDAGAEMVLLNPVFDYPFHLETFADGLEIRTEGT